jgi:two-component system response regulator
MNDWFEVEAKGERSPKSKWLLIEESPFVRAQFKEAFSSQAFELLEAKDILRAADLLSTHQVQLIICDINLLRMNGVALVESIRRSSQGMIPLYILSEATKVDMLDESEKFGAVGWLTKPPVAKEIAAIIKKI